MGTVITEYLRIILRLGSQQKFCKYINSVFASGIDSFQERSFLVEIVGWFPFNNLAKDIE